MRQIVFLFLLLSTAATHAGFTETTPGEVYAQVLLIERETELVRRTFKPASQPHPWQPVQGEILPRHAWQKAYMVQIKIVVFRRTLGLVALTPVSVEPRRNTEGILVWAQTQRLLTEIRFIRKMLGIPGEVGALPPTSSKNWLEVYDKLAEIELQWDDLAGVASGDPSLVFAQALRLEEDVNALMRALNVFDNAIPPAKRPDAIPADSLAEAFQVLEQIQRLQRLGGFEIADFSPFHRTRDVTPDHVFNLICLMLGEFQQVKAQSGLTHVITPPATYQENKVPADVVQLLGYVANKLRLIQHL